MVNSNRSGISGIPGVPGVPGVPGTSGIYGEADKLVSVIKSTKEFNEYMQAKNLIEKNPSLKKEVFEVNRKLEGIYSSNQPVGIIQAKAAELKRQSAGLYKIPEVERFIRASNIFNDMMAKVLRFMNDSLEAEMKFK